MTFTSLTRDAGRLAALDEAPNEIGAVPDGIVRTLGRLEVGASATADGSSWPPTPRCAPCRTSPTAVSGGPRPAQRRQTTDDVEVALAPAGRRVDHQVWSGGSWPPEAAPRTYVLEYTPTPGPVDRCGHRSSADTLGAGLVASPRDGDARVVTRSDDQRARSGTLAPGAERPRSPSSPDVGTPPPPAGSDRGRTPATIVFRCHPTPDNTRWTGTAQGPSARSSAHNGRRRRRDPRRFSTRWRSAPRPSFTVRPSANHGPLVAQGHRAHPTSCRPELGAAAGGGARPLTEPVGGSPCTSGCTGNRNEARTCQLDPPRRR